MQPKTPKLLEDVRDAAVTLAAEWCRKRPAEGMLLEVVRLPA